MKKKSKKKGSGMKKGGKYERLICKRLSLWWTENKRDDIFWRTAGSGGRATQRKKNKQDTYGQHGDVQATDPIGEPLTMLCSIEIKCGYSSNTFSELLEKNQNPKVKACLYQKFIEQAEISAEAGKTYAWIVISKRNGRTPIVIMPGYFYKALKQYHTIGARVTFDTGGELQTIFITTLDEFLDIDRDVFENLYDRKR